MLQVALSSSTATEAESVATKIDEAVYISKLSQESEEQRKKKKRKEEAQIEVEKANLYERNNIRTD